MGRVHILLGTVLFHLQQRQQNKPACEGKKHALIQQCAVITHAAKQTVHIAVLACRHQQQNHRQKAQHRAEHKPAYTAGVYKGILLCKRIFEKGDKLAKQPYKQLNKHQEDTQCNTNMYQPGQLAAIAAEPTGKIVKDRRMPTFRHREYPGDCLCDGLKYRS